MTEEFKRDGTGYHFSGREQDGYIRGAGQKIPSTVTFEGMAVQS